MQVNGWCMKRTLEERLQRAAELIDEADAILILAGAGMGVDSGMPDFRGKNGFWEAYPLLARKGLKFQDMANPRAFEIMPHLAWGFYGQRLNLYRTTQPHQGYAILNDWVSQKSGNGFVFTSNVDGHFVKAGFNDQSLVECHGSLHWFQPLDEYASGLISAEGFDITVDEETLMATSLPQVEDRLLRPNVLMFEDYYWNDARLDDQSERFKAWLKRNQATRKVVIELGAGTAIPRVRQMTQTLMSGYRHTLKSIQINPMLGRYADVGIELGALDALRRIEDCRA